MRQLYLRFRAWLADLFGVKHNFRRRLGAIQAGQTRRKNQLRANRPPNAPDAEPDSGPW